MYFEKAGYKDQFNLIVLQVKKTDVESFKLPILKEIDDKSNSFGYMYIRTYIHTYVHVYIYAYRLA